MPIISEPRLHNSQQRYGKKIVSLTRQVLEFAETILTKEVDILLRQLASISDTVSSCPIERQVSLELNDPQPRRKSLTSIESVDEMLHNIPYQLGTSITLHLGACSSNLIRLPTISIPSLHLQLSLPSISTVPIGFETMAPLAADKLNQVTELTLANVEYLLTDHRQVCDQLLRANSAHLVFFDGFWVLFLKIFGDASMIVENGYGNVTTNINSDW